MLQYNIDITMTSETWFNEKIDSGIVRLDGFNLFRKDRLKRKGGDVCINIRNKVTCEIIWPTKGSAPRLE